MLQVTCRSLANPCQSLQICNPPTPRVGPAGCFFGGDLSGPRCLQKYIFSMIFSTSFWYPHVLDLGGNLAPTCPQVGDKIHPTSLQEPSKIYTMSHLMFDLFFDSFLIDFERIWEPKSDQKTTTNRSKNQPNNATTKIAKNITSSLLFPNSALHLGF